MADIKYVESAAARASRNRILFPQARVVKKILVPSTNHPITTKESARSKKAGRKRSSSISVTETPRKDPRENTRKMVPRLRKMARTICRLSREGSYGVTVNFLSSIARTSEGEEEGHKRETENCDTRSHRNDFPGFTNAQRNKVKNRVPQEGTFLPLPLVVVDPSKPHP